MANRTHKLLIVLGFVAAFAAGTVTGKKEEQSMTAIKVQENALEIIGSAEFDKQAVWLNGYNDGRADTDKLAKQEVEQAIESIKKGMTCEQKRVQIIIRDRFAPWPLPNQYPTTKS